MTSIGKKPPVFSLPDQNNNIHSLNDYVGKWLLIYFYPRDLTPGCTIESKKFEHLIPEFKKNNARVIGISKLDVKSKKKFCDKEGLTFPLLADEDLSTIRAYGVLKDKNMYGKLVKGIQRDSFLIDPSGVLVKHYEKVKPILHPDEVLEDIKKLKNAA
jgi:thioredoxin-dependent peroxiredoxin